MSGPTFVARFADGQTTRMSTHTALDKLDMKRGVRLSRHAYSSRVRKDPPAILKAHFESADGDVLAEYTQEQLAKLTV
jgi:hypothetical protein